MLAGRVDSESKAWVAEEAARRGVTQEEIINEMVAHYMNTGGIAPVEAPSLPTPTPTIEVPPPVEAVIKPVETAKEPSAEPVEIEEEEIDPLFSNYSPKLAEEVNCIVLGAWDRLPDNTATWATSDFLLNFSEDLDRLATTPRRYDCDDELYQDVLPVDVQNEINDILVSGREELGLTTDKETIFRVLADFSRQRSDNLFEDGRAVKLKFNRIEWSALDKLTAKAKGEEVKIDNLPGLIRYLLGKEMLQLGDGGIFGTSDPQLLEIGRSFQNAKLVAE